MGTGLTFACPICAKRMKWKQELIGRRGRCGCGEVIVIPEAPEEDLALAPAAVAQEEQSAPVRHQTAPAFDASRLVGLKKPLAPEPSEEIKPMPFALGVLAPIALIVVGVAVCFVDATYKGPGAPSPALSQIMLPTVLQLVLAVGLGIGAVYLASAFGGVSFVDPVWQVILKLCAVAILPGPVGGLVQHFVGGINGDIFCTFTTVGLYFGLFMLLFRMAIGEKAICVLAIWIVRVGVAYMAFRLQGAKMGSAI